MLGYALRAIPTYSFLKLEQRSPRHPSVARRFALPARTREQRAGVRVWVVGVSKVRKRRGGTQGPGNGHARAFLISDSGSHSAWRMAALQIRVMTKGSAKPQLDMLERELGQRSGLLAPELQQPRGLPGILAVPLFESRASPLAREDEPEVRGGSSPCYRPSSDRRT